MLFFFFCLGIFIPTTEKVTKTKTIHGGGRIEGGEDGEQQKLGNPEPSYEAITGMFKLNILSVSSATGEEERKMKTASLKVGNKQEVKSSKLIKC